MSLKDEMILTNITCDDSSGVDAGGKWIDNDNCHFALRFNEDDEEDVEFHMLLAVENLEILQEVIRHLLATQPNRLN